MKKYVVLAIILAAGITAYPQATRSARETKSDKGSAKKETVNRSAGKTEVRSGSERKASAQASNQASRTKTYSSDSRQKQVERSTATQSRSSVETQKSARPAATQTRTRVETQKSERPVATQSRSNVETQRSARPAATQSQTRVEQQRAERPVAPARSQVNTRTTERAVSPDMKPGSSANSREATRIRESDEPGQIRMSGSSANRVYREGRGTLTTDDGRVIRHQNDEVFAKRKYKVDYDSYDNLRRSNEFRTVYHDYSNWYNHRVVRVVHHYPRYRPIPFEVRRVRYVYRHPVHINLVWTPLLFHRFMYYYPTHTYWNMEFGREIETISGYDAMDYAGTVKRVYGKVEEVFYSREDGNYVLYIGDRFPYQDLSIVIPRHVARDITRNPEWYFENEMVWVVGLINMWEGKPEIVIRDEEQIRRY